MLYKRLVACVDREVAARRKGKPFDAAACAESAVDKFAKAASRLKGCPPCLAWALDGLGRSLVSYVAEAVDEVYCVGSEQISTESGGLVPPDGATATCAKKLGTAGGRLFAHLTACQKRAAKALLAGKPFDRAQCELAATVKYNDAVDKAAGCRNCVCASCQVAGAKQRRDRLLTTLRRSAGALYCAGAEPWP
jgi:hypothetical protein